MSNRTERMTTFVEQLIDEVFNDKTSNKNEGSERANQMPNSEENNFNILKELGGPCHGTTSSPIKETESNDAATATTKSDDATTATIESNGAVTATPAALLGAKDSKSMPLNQPDVKPHIGSLEWGGDIENLFPCGDKQQPGSTNNA